MLLQSGKAAQVTGGRANFHEAYTQAAVKPPSERATGFVFTAIAAIVAYVWRGNAVVLYAASGAAVLLAALSLLAPKVLQPLNLAWFQFSLALHRVVNPIVMLIIFSVVFVPAGALMRLWRDPLRARRAGSGESYWIACDEQPSSMKNQF
jgi:hypothetical protein